MKATKVEHIGIAVRSLEEAIPCFERLLGTPCYGVEEVSEQKVKTAFFRVGETKIELLESTAPESPIGKFLEKKGEGVHHVAFGVDALPAALAELEDGGIPLIDRVPRRGAEGLDIAFLHPKSTHGVLVELCHHHQESKGR
jgi:methylmalonyl-CoA/ethylmalonyl-CoA epimerase